jgi:hypothetical protein
MEERMSHMMRERSGNNTKEGKGLLQASDQQCVKETKGCHVSTKGEDSIAT